jgi:hypothetical protein
MAIDTYDISRVLKSIKSLNNITIPLHVLKWHLNAHWQIYVMLLWNHESFKNIKIFGLYS